MSFDCAAGEMLSPAALPQVLRADASPRDVLSFFERTPYRPDGAIDQRGDFTFFADQQTILSTPGLNCSGFVVAFCRYFLKRNYHLNDVVIDRMADSGFGAEQGEDWDFGYDLILNLTEGMERKVMLPFGQTAAIDGSDGAGLRGFALHDLGAWADVMARMTANHLYLFSMSKPVNFKNYKILHHHVGVIVMDDEKHLWLGHATTKAGVVSMDISNLDQLKLILDSNPDRCSGQRMILIIEVALPHE
ncbi:MAG: hypothetical protein J7K75_10495 [Desulfuromonas sp.]|nr:hypothetical protein [Desulfuromonas sp.]